MDGEHNGNTGSDEVACTKRGGREEDRVVGVETDETNRDDDDDDGDSNEARRSE